MIGAPGRAAAGATDAAAGLALSLRVSSVGSVTAGGSRLAGFGAAAGAALRRDVPARLPSRDRRDGFMVRLIRLAGLAAPARSATVLDGAAEMSPR